MPDRDATKDVEGRRALLSAVPVLALLLGLGLWLWPIGLGSKMPVGGDVTQFSMGLMAVLGRALRSGRLPLWNDLWGYGFPGVAESQMGVFYPPHLVLYGLLPTETAYTTSLVLHTWFGGLGVFWAARRLGITATGALLAGFAWSASGFFVIHLPHQWGYTTGSWMPWAWGLAWGLVGGAGGRRSADAFGLATVLTLQILPGHFQLAFCTQASVALLGLWALAEWAKERSRERIRGIAALALALTAVVPLAAAQLWPTFRLAQLAATRRDYEYLSGFAATPLHVISYLAPSLFQRSPLWRPLVWDPFHTAPEEHLAYLGLAPLFLALGAARRRFRHDPATRALTVLSVGTLVLSLGPYVPGFSLLCQLPGFSFFRASARWGLATALALALLAGQGFDSLSKWPRPGRSLVRFAIGAGLALLLVVAGVELALGCTDRPGWPRIASGFDRGLRVLPWPDGPDIRALGRVARSPQGDLRVRLALARQGRRDVPTEGLRFVDERKRIYLQELGPTTLLLAGVLIVASLARRPRWLAAGLLALTVIDLGVLARLRPIDLAPLRPLIEQSPVLARLGKEPHGTRTADSLRNMPMVVGCAPLAAYRTLDLPTHPGLTAQAVAPVPHPSLSAALRATGTGVRVFDPIETRGLSGCHFDLPGWADRETIRDPALAGWLFGPEFVAQNEPWASDFTLWKPSLEPTRSWLVPLTSRRDRAILGSSDDAEFLTFLNRATPLPSHAPVPEVLEIEVPEGGPEVRAVLVSQLALPNWRGEWIRTDGGHLPLTIEPVGAGSRRGGWQAIKVPEPGPGRLRLRYDGRDVYQGLAVSGVSWLVGVGAWFVVRWRSIRRKGG